MMGGLVDGKRKGGRALCRSAWCDMCAGIAGPKVAAIEAPGGLDRGRASDRFCPGADADFQDEEPRMSRTSHARAEYWGSRAIINRIAELFRSAGARVQHWHRIVPEYLVFEAHPEYKGGYGATAQPHTSHVLTSLQLFLKPPQWLVPRSPPPPPLDPSPR